MTNRDDDVDPRDVAYTLERAAFFAALRDGPAEATVTISAELAHKIAGFLRRAPLKQSRPQRSLYDLNYFNGLVEKARRHKAELVAGGMKAVDAEWEAADAVEAATKKRWSVETIRRAMQRKTDGK